MSPLTLEVVGFERFGLLAKEWTLPSGVQDR